MQVLLARAEVVQDVVRPLRAEELQVQRQRAQAARVEDPGVRTSSARRVRRAGLPLSSIQHVRMSAIQTVLSESIMFSHPVIVLSAISIPWGQKNAT